MKDEIRKEETTNAVLAQKLDGFKELVDTRFKNMETTLNRIEINSAGFASKEDLSMFKTESEKKYVTNDQFFPVRNIVYGLVATILFAVIGGILTLVIIK